MSISQAHSEAARQNGAHSKGPATIAGKARSSQNARKHNLLGSTTLLSCEDQEEFDTIATGFLEEYQPHTPTEHHYVREMVDAEFRLQRVRNHAVSIQQSRMEKICESPDNNDAAEAFRQLAEEGPSLTLLLRYENQFRRQFEKSVQQLRQLRQGQQSAQKAENKAAAKAYEKALHDYVMGPVPGEPGYENRPPAPTPPEPAKPSNINARKEPSAPATTPRQTSVMDTFRSPSNLGPYFGNFGQ